MKKKAKRLTSKRLGELKRWLKRELAYDRMDEEFGESLILLIEREQWERENDKHWRYEQ